MRRTRDAGRLTGFMLGMMIGDSIGLPFEGIGRGRVARLLGSRPLRHRLVGRFGLVSDDTEHMLMTVAAWRQADGDVEAFARSLAWRLRFWMLSTPPATGLATARACIKLLVGFGPQRSGVRSAGNGPVMRAGVLGLLCDSDDELRAFSRAAARITHTDVRAEHGALAVALAARASAESPDRRDMRGAFADSIERLLPAGDMREAVERAMASADRGEPTEAYAHRIGCGRGVSGFVMHTVPVVLHLWLSAPDDACQGIERIVRMGGDTDTTGAVLGGLLGARPTAGGLPQDWLDGIRDFPITVALVRRVAREAAVDRPGPDRRSARWLARCPRNLLFLVIVLVHAMRRMLPPYEGRG